MKTITTILLSSLVLNTTVLAVPMSDADKKREEEWQKRNNRNQTSNSPKEYTREERVKRDYGAVIFDGFQSKKVLTNVMSFDELYEQMKECNKNNTNLKNPLVFIYPDETRNNVAVRYENNTMKVYYGKVSGVGRFNGFVMKQTSNEVKSWVGENLYGVSRKCTVIDMFTDELRLKYNFERTDTRYNNVNVPENGIVFQSKYISKEPVDVSRCQFVFGIKIENCSNESIKKTHLEGAEPTMTNPNQINNNWRTINAIFISIHLINKETKETLISKGINPDDPIKYEIMSEEEQALLSDRILPQL